MADYETPKPQSILHQVGRLGSRIAKPLTTCSNRKPKSDKKSTVRDGVYADNGDIVYEHNDGETDDFSSVSNEEYEENVLESCDFLPEITEKCDGNSRDGKVVNRNTQPGEKSSTTHESRERRRGESSVFMA